MAEEGGNYLYRIKKASSQMKEFLTKIISAIISEGLPVEIQEEKNGDLTLFTIVVPESEIGKVIGKEGKVINAIRCLTRLKGIKEGKRVLVKIADQNGKGFSLPTATEPSKIISG